MSKKNVELEIICKPKLQATEDLENLEEAEKHMTNGLAQFEKVEEAGDEGDYGIVSEKYLEPLRLQFHEPDWSKLERKPEKPPVPQVLVKCFVVDPL